MRTLALAVSAQYRVALDHGVVLQDHTVPKSMQDAMSLLGRLALEEGREDRFASVHDVLHACTVPLREWDLDAFKGNFTYANLQLVDPDLLVPTEECGALMVEGGRSHDDVIERQLYARLQDALKNTGRQRDRTYRVVREFLARHSLTTRAGLRGHFDGEGVDDAVTDLVLGHLFIPVPEAWTLRGQPHRCVHCGTLTRPHPDRDRFPGGRCPLQACREGEDFQAQAEPFGGTGAIVAANTVLRYWVNPAIDELRIFDAAVEAGVPAELYPHSDKCDVSLGGNTGVDVKNYRDAHALARKMSADPGGLKEYRVPVLAVPDARAAQPGYLSALKRGLKRGPGARLRVMTVREVKRDIRELAHA
ncbi:hypothetical protein DAERI_050025 [Deinococcus aerius]|uniref:REase associating with pPIWI RE domain-containing protein n=1 Tax=Deinococcus aerius TaxID=200253 RepID=A0A2I9D4E3_9DEIO|nr:hypothetical protein DAERI_050025 [Deinococcus aerius]